MSKLLDIIRNHDWLLEPSEQEIKNGDLELQGWTPAGENYYIYLQGETEQEMLTSMTLLADTFDVDEHVEMWLSSRGQNGVPATARELVEDAEWIMGELEEIASEARGAYD